MPAGGPRHGIKVVKGAIIQSTGRERGEGVACLVRSSRRFNHFLQHTVSVGRGGSIENSFNSTSEFWEISMSRPRRGRSRRSGASEARRGEAVAHDNTSKMWEKERERERESGEHAPRWNVRYPIRPMTLLQPRPTATDTRDRSP